MLGISRGTLRLALERLAANGEIVRRQGSGTYVGRVAVPAAFSEGLEVLESYASLARRQGHSVKGRGVAIAQQRAPGFVAEALNLRKGSTALCVERTLLVDKAPAAHMRDWIHPSVCPSIYPSLRPFIRQFVCPRPSVRPSVILSLCPFLCPSVGNAGCVL